MDLQYLGENLLMTQCCFGISLDLVAQSELLISFFTFMNLINKSNMWSFNI